MGSRVSGPRVSFESPLKFLGCRRGCYRNIFGCLNADESRGDAGIRYWKMPDRCLSDGRYGSESYGYNPME